MSEVENCPLCLGSGKLDDVFLPKTDLDNYPVNRDFYEPKDALDIKKTNQTWMALVKCDSKYGMKTRFYNK